MHKEEIRRLIGKVEQKGFTLVPLDLHYKGGRVKAEIALAKGKAEHDKRNTEKKRDWEREHGRLMRHKVVVAGQALTRRKPHDRRDRSPAAIRDAPSAPARDRRAAAPPGLPLVGNTLQIDKPRMHQQVERWVRRVRRPTSRFRIGRRRILVIADHKAMGALLRDRPGGFPAHASGFAEIAARSARRRSASSAPRARPGSGSGGW